VTFVQTLNKSEKMSNLQFFILIIAVIIPFGHFVYVDIGIKAAGRDTWIAVLFAGVIALGIAYLQFSVAARYPDKSLSEYTIQVFGRLFGTAIAIVYATLFVTLSATTLHVSDLFLGVIYPRTPILVFTLSFLGLTFWVLREGIEVLSRVAQLILPFLLVLGLTASILTIKDKHVANLFPVLHNNWLPVSHATTIFIAMFSEMILFSTMMSNAQTPQHLPKRSLIFVGLLTFMFLGPATGAVMIFGEPLAQAVMYPTYVEISYIEYTSILERLDVLGLTLWILGAYLRLSGFCFGTTRVLTNILNMKDERKLAWVTMTIVGAFSIYLDHTLSRDLTYDYILRFGVPILPVIGIGLPLLTLLTDVVKKRLTGPAKRNHHGSKTNTRMRKSRGYP